MEDLIESRFLRARLRFCDPLFISFPVLGKLAIGVAFQKIWSLSRGIIKQIPVECKGFYLAPENLTSELEKPRESPDDRASLRQTDERSQQEIDDSVCP